MSKSARTGDSKAVAITLPFARTKDTDFLPASLELLLAPTSPIATSFIFLVAAIAFSVIAWSYFGRLDIYAVATGKIQPSGRSKIVQPFEPGKVASIKVQNGTRVSAGDVLLQLDSTDAVAEWEAAAHDLASARAEARRRRAAVAAAESAGFLLAATPIAASPESTDRESAGLDADLAQLKSSIDVLRKQIAEKAATESRLKASIEERQRLIELSRERVKMRSMLDAKGVGSRALVIEANEELERELTTDAAERGQIIENDAAVVSLESKMSAAEKQFVSEQTEKLIEAERKADRLTQDLVKAQSKVTRARLTAPIDGTVQQLSITTLGQVVTTGQSLMVIVPFEAPIEVEAYVSNRDIGFVEVGQHVIIKVDAFPFTRFGTIEGEVVRIAKDGVDERDATGDATSASRTQGASREGGRNDTLVFPTTISLKKSLMTINDHDVAMVPGMSVSVEIKTGERRAIDFVLSPLREVSSSFGHER